MVGERGFEPPTPWSRTRCSTRLSHSPTCAGALEEMQSALAGIAEVLANYNTPAISEC